MWPFTRKAEQNRRPQFRKVFISDGEGWQEAPLHMDADGRRWVSSRHGWMELADGGVVLEASGNGMSMYGQRRWRDAPVLSRAVEGA